MRRCRVAGVHALLSSDAPPWPAKLTSDVPVDHGPAAASSCAVTRCAMSAIGGGAGATATSEYAPSRPATAFGTGGEEEPEQRFHPVLAAVAADDPEYGERLVELQRVLLDGGKPAHLEFLVPLVARELFQPRRVRLDHIA